jgi:hypothetical protein
VLATRSALQRSLRLVVSDVAWPSVIAVELAVEPPSRTGAWAPCEKPTRVLWITPAGRARVGLPRRLQQLDHLPAARHSLKPQRDEDDLLAPADQDHGVHQAGLQLLDADP